MLLEHGAITDATDYSGLTPLIIAAIEGSIDIIEVTSQSLTF